MLNAGVNVRCRKCSVTFASASDQAYCLFHGFFSGSGASTFSDSTNCSKATQHDDSFISAACPDSIVTGETCVFSSAFSKPATTKAEMPLRSAAFFTSLRKLVQRLIRRPPPQQTSVHQIRLRDRYRVCCHETLLFFAHRPCT